MFRRGPEREALKREEELPEHTKKAKARQKEIEAEMTQLREKTSSLEARWNNEKTALGDMRKMKKELEELRIDAVNAEAVADLTRAAEIRYSLVPKLEKKLEEKTDKLKKLQKNKRILKEEVTEEDIAKVVARWATGRCRWWS